MLLLFILAFLLLASATTASALRSLDSAPVIHFTLARRGGVFAATQYLRDYVNVTYLAQQLEATESRFNVTQRQVQGNRLVRKPKKGFRPGGLLGEVAAKDIWYAKISIGNPPQEIEVDLNMLVSDFYVVTTTSRKGTRYDDYFSQSSIASLERPYPSCKLPTDLFYLPFLNRSVPISFAHCRPSKSSLNTLEASGSTLGLAPSEHLSQTGSTSLLKQLLEKGVIERPLFSIMLINGQEGVLSIGGTAADAVQRVVSQTKNQLDLVGNLDKDKTVPEIESKSLVKRGRKVKDIVSRQGEQEEGWVWNKVQGAEGWWQLLMQGVWVDGSKVLQNQAVVIDMNSPFILAPPLATKAFYASVSGSRPLPPPFSNFYVYPCLNPPAIHFEFGGTNFPFMRGGRGAEWTGIPGGKFSLGRLANGSGYCVGAVVETEMGIREEKDKVVFDGKRSTRSVGGRGGLGGNGMRDVWVIGEGFFRGVGGVFDFEENKVGFQAY